MDERDVIERLGVPDEIARRGQTMRRHTWRCSDCGEVTRSAEPIERPAPCVRCGGVWFRTP